MADDNSSNFAIGILVIAFIIFIVVFALVMYYSYSGSSGDSSSSDDDCENNTWTWNGCKPKKCNKPPKKNCDDSNNVSTNIRNSMNDFDRTFREPFIANGRPSPSSNNCNDSKIATTIRGNTTISDNTTSGKLFIIDSSCPVEVKLPRRTGLTLKFWNNSRISHTLRGHVPIFDESSSDRQFSIGAGQFAILESLGEMWLITTKTKTGSTFKPCKPCKFNPDEQCDITDSLDSQVNSLLDGGWQN